MKLYLIAMLIIFALSSCSYDGRSLRLGLPDYEKRNSPVSALDLQILLRANELLTSKSAWANSDSRACADSDSYSLFCALERAATETIGSYDHRQAAIQEVRFVIDDNYKDRWRKHRLADFNSNSDTTFEDVKGVLELAIQAVKIKLTHNNANQQSHFVAGSVLRAAV